MKDSTADTSEQINGDGMNGNGLSQVNGLLAQNGGRVGQGN